jgi:hypothetical protein
MCTAVLTGWDPATFPLPPHWDSNTRALLVSKDRRHLFVTPAHIYYADSCFWTDYSGGPALQCICGTDFCNGPPVKKSGAADTHTRHQHYLLLLILLTVSNTFITTIQAFSSSWNTFFSVLSSVFHLYFFIIYTGFRTDKKENQIFLIYKEIQNGVAKSYMTNGLLIY